MNSPSSRRAFLGAAGALSYGRIVGANERIRVGFIGCGLIGMRHISDFRQQPDVEAAAVCDVYTPRQEAARAACGNHPAASGDFRRVLDDKGIDAVVISTPDHWHALQTMMACAAGKDVYVEKPMTLFVREGRWMTTVARRYRRVVQVGTQGRSGAHFTEVLRLIGAGHIGRIHSVRIGTFRNVMPGFGNPPDSAPPAGMDYEMWLGPAPARAYNRNRALYNFRWFWDYSGGQMTNLGAHDIDLVHYALKVNSARAAYSSGGRLCLQDNGETPDVQDAILEYPDFNIIVSIREASGGRGAGAGTELFGTKGSMTIGRSGFTVFPDMDIPAQGQIPQWSRPPGHPQAVDGVRPRPRTGAVKGGETGDDPLPAHTRNFLDCVKSRGTPVADVEQGHLVAVSCHLANLSLRLGRRLRWDAIKEDVVDDREASALLERPYRKPWDETLRSFRL